MIILKTVFICVCITYVSPASLTRISLDDYVPCETGWYYFRDKCYRIQGREPSEILSWHDALARCKSYGADLASLQSEEELTFIASYMLLNSSWWAWITFNGEDNIEDSNWIYRSVTNYPSTHSENPSYHYLNDPDFCIQLHLLKDIIGSPKPEKCSETLTYICEKDANKEVSSRNPAQCSLEEGGGLKNKNSCYHVIQEKKSWDNAENYCQEHYNGHLLTIHDFMEDSFLVLGIPVSKQDMWIGIKMANLRELKWTSGWYVAYEGYSRQIKNITEGSCVARKVGEDFVAIPCSTELPFICEVSKEKPPALKPPPVGAHCPENQAYWRDFGGEYCYYFEPRRAVTFDEANEICISRAGHLASLHSEEEADVLQPFFKYIQASIHIGLHREEGESGIFSWMDGTELDYQNWNDGEPDKVQEPCVEMWILTKKWNAIPCNKADVGYVCSVKKVPKFYEEHSTLSSRSEEENIDETLPAGTDLVLLVIYWFQRLL